MVGARGVVPVNVLGRGADRWGLLVLELLLVLLLLALVLVFSRLRMKERREVGAFRCISAFFRHVCSVPSSFLFFLPHGYSFTRRQTLSSLSFCLGLSCCCG